MTVAVVAGCVELWKYRTCVPECASNTYVSLISECSDTKNPVDNHVEILWTTPKLCTMLWKTFPCFMCEIAGASKMKKTRYCLQVLAKGCELCAIMVSLYECLKIKTKRSLVIVV